MTNEDLSDNKISSNQDIDDIKIKLINDAVDEIILSLNELAETNEIEKFIKKNRYLHSIYKNIQL